MVIRDDSWNPYQYKGFVKRVSDDPVTYLVSDVESALLSDVSTEEVQGLLAKLKRASSKIPSRFDPDFDYDAC